MHTMTMIQILVGLVLSSWLSSSAVMVSEIFDGKWFDIFNGSWDDVWAVGSELGVIDGRYDGDWDVDTDGIFVGKWLGLSDGVYDGNKYVIHLAFLKVSMLVKHNIEIHPMNHRYN